MIDVTVQVVATAPGVPAGAAMRDWVAAALDGAHPGAEVVVRVVDEDDSRALNRDYRGRDAPTNVLSFPFEPPPGFGPMAELGDLVICAGVVSREAREQGKVLQHHWAHMVVHGTLHLMGYDHEEEAEAERMEALERRILARLGMPDPYRVEGEARTQA